MSVQDEPLHRNTAVMLARTDAHVAWLLGCDLMALARPAVQVIPTARRRARSTVGAITPIIAVKPHTGNGCVLSCAPELSEALRERIAGLDTRARPFDPAWRAALDGVDLAGRRPRWSSTIIYVTDSVHFRPHGVDPSVRVERFPDDERPPRAIMPERDGPQFAIRAPQGEIAAWAGVHRASDIAWEIAAETEPEYRGRGLATVLTARATAEALAHDRLAIWLAPEANEASRRLVERLGYHEYGEQLTASLAEE